MNLSFYDELDIILRSHSIEPTLNLLTWLASTADGLAMAAVLINATAKTAPQWYCRKGDYVEAACRQADQEGRAWWVTTHRQPTLFDNKYLNQLNRLNQYLAKHHVLLFAENYLTVFIETSVMWNNEALQVAFHFPPSAPNTRPPDFTGLVVPGSQGRLWRGQQVQSNIVAILQMIAERPELQ